MTFVADPSATRSARYSQLVALTAFLVILALPTPEGLNASAQRVAAVAAAMGILWLTQALPLAATSLIPLAAFPMMGIQGAQDVSSAYINDSVFLYLGGFVIALGIERWGLHRRIALHVVRRVGTGPRRIVLGFALATAFLSMWISNTAAAMLMIPIAIALLHSLDEIASTDPASSQRSTDRLAVALMLAVAYSASIGGMTTLVGTPTNIAFREIFSTTFPGAPEISAGQWMTSFIPLGIAMLTVMWLTLTLRLKPIPGTEALGRTFFDERIRGLGSPSPAERRMFIVFAATALLWLFRSPISLSGDTESTPLVPGWGPHVASLLVSLGVPEESASKLVTDSTVAMFMAVAMFIIPAGRSKPSTSPNPVLDQSPESDEPLSLQHLKLMDWPTANRLPWEVLLLFGGGFALAEGFAATGLSEWIGKAFATTFSDQPVWVLVFATCFLLTFLTEFTSNTATCNIVLPILAPAAVQMGVDPRLVMVGAALSASCAFMLPVATPPNALVFGSGRVTVGQMARSGFCLNLIGVVFVTAAVLWIYAPLAGIKTTSLPNWATEPLRSAVEP